MPDNTVPAHPVHDDADWRRIRETVLMLNLAVAQISNAMREGDDSVNTLTGSFATTIDSIQTIHEQTARLPEGAERRAIDQACNTVQGQMQKTIVAFQFYDKLSQRLNHLSHSLARFAELLESHRPVLEPAAWQKLQDDIKARFPVESDKLMFDAILQGASVAEVLEYLHMGVGSEDEEGVEFF